MKKFILSFVIFISTCNVIGQKLFSKVSPIYSKVDFSNNITETKFINFFSYLNIYNGGGIGLGDINNDGLPDIFFTSNQGENQLYLNAGNLTFKNITTSTTEQEYSANQKTHFHKSD